MSFPGFLFFGNLHFIIVGRSTHTNPSLAYCPLHRFFIVKLSQACSLFPSQDRDSSFALLFSVFPSASMTSVNSVHNRAFVHLQMYKRERSTRQFNQSASKRYKLISLATKPLL